MGLGSYQVIQFPGFGRGLNLHDKADAVLMDEAVDALNVEHTRHGAVRQRDGYDNLTASELTNQPDSMHPYTTTGGTRYLVVGNGVDSGANASIHSLNTSGTAVRNNLQDSVANTASPNFFAAYAAPGGADLFISNGTDEVRMLSGTTFSVPDYELTAGGTDVGLKAKFVSVDTTSNRLVAAENKNSTGFAAATNTQDTVRFSDAGDPTVWGDNNYVHLSPGDGEPIMGVIGWRELVFVFKQTKFFVFYGEGVDGAGEPEFQFRTFDTGIGLASSRALCAGRDGVYFMDRKGVYQTTGQEAKRVSENVEPIFFSGASPFFQGGTLLQSQITNCVMHWINERVYLAYTSTSTTNNYMLVFDTRYGWWTLWNIPASCMATFRPSDNDELVFGYSTGSNYVGRFSFVPDTYANDDAVAITSRWQSGWADLGTPNEKYIRQTRVSGEGKVSVGVADDFQTSANTPTLLDFSVTQPLTGTAIVGTAVVGPIPSYKTKLHRVAGKGKVFSLMASNSTLNQGFTIQRADYELKGMRGPALSVDA